MKDEISSATRVHIDDKAFEKLESDHDLQISPAERARLNTAISYSVRLRDWQEAYSKDSRKKRFRVAAHARKLKSALNELSESAFMSVVLGDDHGFAHFMGPVASPADVEHFVKQLDAVIEQAERTAPDGYELKHERPFVNHRFGLCEVAIEVYENSGRRAGIGGDRSGSFANFVGDLNEFIPEGYRAPSADRLVKDAQVALSRRKTRRERAVRAGAARPEKSP